MGNVVFSFLPSFILLLIVNSFSQTDSDSLQQILPQNPSSIIVSPVLVIYSRNISQSILLHNLEPTDDSCADVEIGFPKIKNVKVHLNFNSYKKWEYSGITNGNNDNDLKKSIIVNLTEDQSNFITKVLIGIKSIDDSIKEKTLPTNLVNDIKIPADTSNPLDFSIERITFICKHHEIIQERKFTYPPDYMRRCPVYNYPELSMFHCGNSIHMPNSESIRLRGVMIFEYHQSNLPKIIYDSALTTTDKRAILEELRRKMEEEKAENRKNKPKKLFFKPLW